MNWSRLQNVVIAVGLAITAAVIADETRAYFNLKRHFPDMEFSDVSTLIPRCSPDHFYGRRISLIRESRQAFAACYDWSADRWKLTVIPGRER